MVLRQHLAFLALSFFVVLQPAQTTKGIDVSSPVAKSAFSCLKGEGYDFLIVRGYRSTGEPDPAAASTIANAKAAGIENIDVYMFPCPKCSKTIKDQVDEMVRAINISYGQIWLDIEGSDYWHSSEESNQDTFKELLSTASGHKRTGVYTSESQWSSIMGSNYTGGSGHQLWYAHYDNNPSFSDFRSFGGWSSPVMKQYAGDKTVCEASVDLNYY